MNKPQNPINYTTFSLWFYIALLLHLALYLCRFLLRFEYYVLCIILLLVLLFLFPFCCLAISDVRCKYLCCVYFSFVFGSSSPPATSFTLLSSVHTLLHAPSTSTYAAPEKYQTEPGSMANISPSCDCQRCGCFRQFNNVSSSHRACVSVCVCASVGVVVTYARALHICPAAGI